MESFANKLPTFGDLTNLSVEKLEELSAVLTIVLALPAARDAYAQIIDGKPTRTPYSEANKRQSPTGKINSISGNSKPTDQAFQEYEKIRKAFAPQDLLIDLKLAQDYQVAPSDSRENRLRLLRIAAASVNALARRKYLNFHPDINIKPPRQPNQFDRTDEFYVNFYHTSYMQFERYPFGLLDVLGYWAETEIFGGVLLFEREESGFNIINAFLRPQEASFAFQLSETQLEVFASLKVGDTVLPFAREADARTELPVVRVGEPPLRIYKNEYDKPSASNWQHVRAALSTKGTQEQRRSKGRWIS